MSSALVVVCDFALFAAKSLRPSGEGRVVLEREVRGPRIVSARSPYSTTSPFRIASASGGASSGARRSNWSNGSSESEPLSSLAPEADPSAPSPRDERDSSSSPPPASDAFATLPRPRPRPRRGRGHARARARARARRLAGTGMGIPPLRPPGRRGVPSPSAHSRAAPSPAPPPARRASRAPPPARPPAALQLLLQRVLALDQHLAPLGGRRDEEAVRVRGVLGAEHGRARDPARTPTAARPRRGGNARSRAPPYPTPPACCAETTPRAS